MEFYDTFDENGTFICSEDEHDVHYKGLWHKVIRIWLYDKEGNLYLRVRKEDGKLDCINELHMQSSESVSSCFDRGMFEKLGIHFPATANIEQASFKKQQKSKIFSDNTEMRDNYFLCDYIGEFDNNVSFFIFGKDTAGLSRASARGILNVLSTRTGEILREDVFPGGKIMQSNNPLGIDDIFENVEESTLDKYDDVLNKIIEITRNIEKERRESQKLEKLVLNRKKREEEEDAKFESHADENEGSDKY